MTRVDSLPKSGVVRETNRVTDELKVWLALFYWISARLSQSSSALLGRFIFTIETLSTISSLTYGRVNIFLKVDSKGETVCADGFHTTHTGNTRQLQSSLNVVSVLDDDLKI